MTKEGTVQVTEEGTSDRGRDKRKGQMTEKGQVTEEGTSDRERDKRKGQMTEEGTRGRGK